MNEQPAPTAGKQFRTAVESEACRLVAALKTNRVARFKTSDSTFRREVTARVRELMEEGR